MRDGDAGHERVRRDLAKHGLVLPEAPTAVGMYVPARIAGSLVFTAGQLPSRQGRLLTTGRVGAEVSIETAAECAAQAALNALAAAATVCDLDSVVAVVRLTGYVASAEGFRDQATVMNGASEVLAAAFGEAGAHSRVAVGVAELPLGAPVEVEVVLSLA
ncbi:MAG: RidA family protein [Coriobacteriia bacterium]